MLKPISFANTKMRDESQPKEPVQTANGKLEMRHPYFKPAKYYEDSVKIKFEVSDRSVMPPTSLSKDKLKQLQSFSSDVKIDVNAEYSLKWDITERNYYEQDGKLYLSATYGTPYRGIEVTGIEW